MRDLHKVTRTSYPCGKTVHYLDARMEPVKLKDLTGEMKNAAFQAVQEQSKPQRKLKVA